MLPVNVALTTVVPVVVEVITTVHTPEASVVQEGLPTKLAFAVSLKIEAVTVCPAKSLQAQPAFFSGEW